MIRGAAALALAAALASPARAAEPDRAYGAYQHGYYLAAVREATRRIEADPSDAAAMTLMGEILARGLGLPPDAAKAAGWYRLAADRGDPHAAYALGAMTVEGLGVIRDEAAGLALIEKAAGAGHAEALHALAQFRLAAGREAEGVEAMRRAAEAGLPIAQHAYARLIREGRGGLSRDADEAALWMGRAAEAGEEGALVDFGAMRFNGDGVARDEREAARLFLRAAAQGNPIAQNRLARLYAAGRGVPRDLVEAAAWHALARIAGREDSWLDTAVAALTEAERARADQLAARRLQAFSLGLASR